MNKDRRKAIAESIERIQSEIENLRALAEEEQEYADNMPENMQGSEKHDMAEELANNMQSYIDEIETAIQSIEEEVNQ